MTGRMVPRRRVFVLKSFANPKGMEAAGVTCGAAWRQHPQSSRRAYGPPRLNPLPSSASPSPGGFASRRALSVFPCFMELGQVWKFDQNVWPYVLEHKRVPTPEGGVPGSDGPCRP